MAVPCVISPNSVAFPVHYVKVHGCRYTEMFCGRIFVAIFAKVTENKCIMHERSHVSDYIITILLTHCYLLISISTTSLIFP